MNKEELIKQMKEAIRTRWSYDGYKSRCPQIRVMAKFIDEHLEGFYTNYSSYGMFTGRESGRIYCSGSSKTFAKLKVYNNKGELVFEHDTYNSRKPVFVAEWIIENMGVEE